MYQIKLKKQFSENTKGRDFVVGDIHGAYSSLMSKMKEVSFDKTKDRLFCTGDLCDRGPNSLQALRLLREDYFHCSIGNHDQFILDFLQANEAGRQAMKKVLIKNGGEWLYKLGENELEEVSELARLMVQKCPMICEVVSSSNEVLFRVAHASLPDFYLTMPDDYEVIDEDMSILCWERSKAEYTMRVAKTSGDEISVEGKRWSVFGAEAQKPLIFLGHTIFPEPTVAAEMVYVDTGGYRSEVALDFGDGKPESTMTLVNVESLKSSLHEHFHQAKHSLKF